MPIPTDLAAATGLPSDSSHGVLPFLRSIPIETDDHEPPRPNAVHAIDDIAEIRAMLGLVLLAAEALPGGHAFKFSSVLEIAHSRLARLAASLKAGRA